MPLEKHVSQMKKDPPLPGDLNEFLKTQPPAIGLKYSQHTRSIHQATQDSLSQIKNSAFWTQEEKQLVASMRSQIVDPVMWNDIDIAIGIIRSKKVDPREQYTSIAAILQSYYDQYLLKQSKNTRF